jgi:co-chaperonin GroES (HSP10)
MEMIRALKTRVIITRPEQERITAGGIVLQSAPEDANPRAVVHDVGPAVTIDIRVGDRVVVDWQYVSQMTYEGAKFYVVDQANVLAVEENE